MQSDFKMELTVKEQHSELGEMEIQVSSFSGGTVAAVRVGGERIDFTLDDLQKVAGAINKFNEACKRLGELE